MNLDEITEVEHRLAEFSNLNNRLERYWKKLVKESLRIAKGNNLTIRAEEDFPHISRDITIYEKDEILDDSRLIDLAKSKFQSLYKRYTQGLIKQELINSELREVYNSL